MLVVLHDGHGQMCNKILFQINVLASSYVRDYKVLYYGKQSFDGFLLEQKELEQRVVYRKKAPKWLYNITRFANKLSSALDAEWLKFVMASSNTQDKVSHLLSKGYLCSHKAYLYGWPFYDLFALRNASSYIREYMCPTIEVGKYVDNEMKKIRDTHTCVIGVHLRRGDYKAWRDGRYFFSDSEYKRCINDLIQEFEIQENIKVLLFSNEEIQVLDFYDKKYSVKRMLGSPAQDFHMMSKCDYLLGPPSSFSGLASFLGKVPRYMIEDANKKMSKNDFLVWLEETDSWGRKEVLNDKK